MIGRTHSAIIEVLTPLWRRVLRRPQIGVDDDFFDQGGNASLAAELLAEVGPVGGRHLRPTAICKAPTIRTMAALLEEPLTASVWPLVLLKPGAERPPVFIAHGIGGSIIDFVPLARRIQVRRPIYGMQVRGIDGDEEPLERVEDMAQYYLEAIKRLQPDGPYFLIGYSLGGQVVLEMAQRLCAKGDTVSLLAIIDSYPHSANLPPRQRLASFLRRAGGRLQDLRKLPMRESISRLVHRVSRKAQTSNGRRLTPHIRRSIASANLAWTRYQPRFYRGRIDFIRAKTVTYFSPEPAAVWGELASEFECETVPGDHVGMITNHVDSLAAALSRRLQEALRREHELSGMNDRWSQMQRRA
jgi:thioesterase domain-containing protein